LRQVGGFSMGPPVSSINKTYHHDITEILLKVVVKNLHVTFPELLPLVEKMIV
jgi:hypothetical protein